MGAVETVNVFDPAWDYEHEREGFRWHALQIGPRIGAGRIGATVYDLREGQRTFPYHYHHGNEEWLLVLDGEPRLRVPAGERTLRRGDLVAFPSGEEGAHTLTGPGRIVIFSTLVRPGQVGYPDSDKVAMRPTEDEHPDRLVFRRSDAVEYWEGE
jgi:uncharacterized cupin superfamily protein